MTPAMHKARVGQRLRIAIEALGMTQAEVCRAFAEEGVTPPKLGNWLRGDNYPNEWFLVRFCDRYELTTDYFLRGRVAGVARDVGDVLWRQEIAEEPASSEE